MANSAELCYNIRQNHLQAGGNCHAQRTDEKGHPDDAGGAASAPYRSAAPTVGSEARAFGDLSENFEYKAAKQEKNQNERRIRFLENMIRTAVVISDQSQADTVGLFDKVTIRLADDDVDETYQVVTTMRQDALRGRISKESPVGKALLGRRVGERFHIQVSERYGYDAVVRAIEKSEDDGSAPLNRF